MAKRTGDIELAGVLTTPAGAAASDDGEDLILAAGSGHATAGAGGNVTISAGVGYGTDDGGNITLSAGANAGTGEQGAIVIPAIATGPTVTANKLFNIAGALTWNGTDISTGGDVNISGTPANNRVAVWTDADTIEGSTRLIDDAGAGTFVCTTSTSAEFRNTNGILRIRDNNTPYTGNPRLEFEGGTSGGRLKGHVGFRSGTMALESAQGVINIIATQGNSDITLTPAGTGNVNIVNPLFSGTGVPLQSVAISDLDNGTDGELITWDASGVATTVPVGTATHVLTSNGAGAAPTFQAAAGGGVDGYIAPVKLATTIDLDSVGNGTWVTTSTLILTAGTPGTTTIDGQVVADGDRIQVKDQTATAENGLFVVSDAAFGVVTVLTRTSDFDTSGLMISGSLVAVQEGTVNFDSLWMMTQDAAITVGTTAITWRDITGGEGFVENIDNSIFSSGAGGSLSSGGTFNFLALDGAGNDLTTGDHNIAIGNNAMATQISASGNIALGQNAMTNGFGTDNVVVGNFAGDKMTNSGFNVVIGGSAGRSLTSAASYNIVLGHSAMGLSATSSFGENNVAVGRNSQRAATIADSNVAIGVNSMILNTAGDGNVAIGGGINGTLGGALTSANYNIGIGWDTGRDWITGATKNIAIGYNAGPASDIDEDNKLYIHNAAGVPFIGGDMGTGEFQIAGTMRFTERADHIGTPAATFGELWLRSDTPNKLIFTDDAGTDHDLAAAGVGISGSPVDNQIPIWINGTTIEGDSKLVYTSGHFTVGGGTDSTPIIASSCIATGNSTFECQVGNVSRGRMQYVDNTDQLEIITNLTNTTIKIGPDEHDAIIVEAGTINTISRMRTTFGGQIASVASTANRAGLNVAEGVAPTVPVDGDVWVTTAGAFNARLNGATIDLAGGGGISNVVEDTTPQLGGNLDVNGNDIVSVSNGDIDIIPNGTGKTKITNIEAPLTQNTQTGTTYTAVLADAEKMITLSNAAAITMTIPANASVAYPIGTKLNFMQLGAGQVTVAITTDTLNVESTLTLLLVGQYAVATAFKVTATTWVLFGNLEAA